MIYLQLYLTFFKIGLFSFGGGYAMIPLIQKEVVDINHWISLKGFLDILSISQSTPGPIAINSATFVGYQVNGVLGSVIATLGVISPAFFIIWGFYKVYQRVKDGAIFNWVFSGIRPIVVALILSAAYSLFGSIEFDYRHALLFVVSMVLLYKTKVNSILWLLLFGLVGIVIF